MNFLNKIFGKEIYQPTMDNSPCLAPWYFDKDKPKLTKDGVTWKWKAVGNCGAGVLADEKDNWYVLISIYYYMLVAQDNKSFLVWKRTLEKTSGLQPIRISYYETDKLQPITGKNKIISRLDKVETLFAVEPTAKFEFAFNPREEAMKFDFPEEFKKFGEFIFITELENLYDNPNPEWHNTTMLLINAENGLVLNYPQDWFNKSNCDFGYQWITRAFKDPSTKIIHGQGIRLDDFRLYGTYRERR